MDFPLEWNAENIMSILILILDDFGVWSAEFVYLYLLLLVDFIHIPCYDMRILQGSWREPTGYQRGGEIMGNIGGIHGPDQPNCF